MVCLGNTMYRITAACQVISRFFDPFRGFPRRPGYPGRQTQLPRRAGWPNRLPGQPSPLSAGAPGRPSGPRGIHRSADPVAAPVGRPGGAPGLTSVPADTLVTGGPANRTSARCLYDLDATSMLLERLGCGIHAISSRHGAGDAGAWGSAGSTVTRALLRGKGRGAGSGQGAVSGQVQSRSRCSVRAGCGVRAG